MSQEEESERRGTSATTAPPPPPPLSRETPTKPLSPDPPTAPPSSSALYKRTHCSIGCLAQKHRHSGPNILMVQAAALLQYIETSESLKTSAYVLFLFCNSQKMHKHVYYTAACHCAASRFHKEITPKSAKSPFALIYRDVMDVKSRFLRFLLQSLLFSLCALDCGSRRRFCRSTNSKSAVALHFLLVLLLDHARSC